MIENEFEERKLIRVDIGKNKFILVDSIQGSKMLFNRHPYRNKYDNHFLTIFYNCWEKKETEFVKSFVKKGMRVVDVGANIGYYTLLLAKLVGESGNVHSFEPSDELMEIVRSSAGFNGYHNIVYHNCAVGDYEQEVVFDKKNFMVDEKRVVNDDHIQMCQIDDSFGMIDFLKSDTDGHDGSVIIGMRDMLINNDTVAMIEYFPEMWERVGTTPTEFFQFVQQFSLNCCVLEDDCHLVHYPVGELLRYPNRDSYTPIEDILASNFPDKTLIVSRLDDDRILRGLSSYSEQIEPIV
jgi:FkbM family methyltransferase